MPCSIARCAQSHLEFSLVHLLQQVVDMCGPRAEYASQLGTQDLVKMSVAYAVYMAVSGNLRYQVVAGVIEERGIEAAFQGRPQLCKALSTVARAGNSVLGSLLWVDFIRFLGMQQTSLDQVRP